MSVIEHEQTRTVTVKDVLTRAADILEEFDWCQGRAGNRKEGSMCAVGAVQEAGRDWFGEFSWDSVGYDLVIASLHALGRAPRDGDPFPLAVWNDKPGRTKAEVVAKLRELAEAAT